MNTRGVITAFAFALTAVTSGSMAVGPRVDASRRIATALSALGPCTHECRTDYCTNPEFHDIVESVNLTHSQGYRTELEECGEHGEATCGAHGCGVESPEAWTALQQAMRELQNLPSEAARAIVAANERLVADPADPWLIRIIGCGGLIVAAVEIRRPSAGRPGVGT